MDTFKSVAEDVLLFDNYVKEKNICGSSEPPWRIDSSSLGGRGIFAIRDIQPNEILFFEPPLVIGPRSEIKCKPICVGCHRIKTVISCSKGCALPVCSKMCEESEKHVRECKLLQSWRSGIKRGKKCGWSAQLLTTLAPIRCLLLDEKDQQIMKRLQGNRLPQHNIIIDFIHNNVNKGPEVEEIQTLRHACEVLDAVAYETLCPEDKDLDEAESFEFTSLRGIYPIAALMNHSCSPNTRHCFDHLNNMVCETTRLVRKDEELTTTYTSLMWGNQVRQQHLRLTKHFQCKCIRCQDPEEYGARLMALYCVKENCMGVLLPSRSKPGKWSCTLCNMTLDKAKIGVIQSAIGSIIASIDMKNPRRACRLLRKRFVIPRSNQLAVELKFKINWLYGHQQGFHWSELTTDDLDMKEIICRELLLLVHILDLGACRLKGLILYELYCTLKEKRQRRIETNEASSEIGMTAEIDTEKEYLTEAAIILKYDASSRKVLEEYKNRSFK